MALRPLQETSPFLQLLRALTQVCPACRMGVPGQTSLCPECLESLEPSPELCAVCWLPHPDIPTTLCPFSLRAMQPAGAALSQSPPILTGFSAVGRAHQVFKAWKIGGGEHASRRSPLRRQVLDHAFAIKPGLLSALRERIAPEWIVPIPQSPNRRWELQGGTSLEIARFLSRKLETPWLNLLSAPPTPHLSNQARLSAAQRMSRATSFSLRESSARILKMGTNVPRILLVDDLTTTGKTLLEAGAALAGQGLPVSGYFALAWRPQIQKESDS